MNLSRNWKWIIVVAALLLLVVGIIIFVVNRPKPQLPSGLVDQRKAALDILAQADEIKDVDIRPLVELEAKKEYAGAVALIENAITANHAYRNLNASLLGVAAGLSQLAPQVQPDAIGAKAVQAFNLLLKFAAAEKKYYDDREIVYQMTHDYYAELAAKKSPPIPENLKTLVDTVTTDSALRKEAEDQFASALQAFDSAAGLK